jgi:hypothetical protein
MKKDIEPGRRADGMTSAQWRSYLDRMTPEQRFAITQSMIRATRRRRGGKDDDLPQPADPTRPLAGEGGAAASLDFD